MEYRSMEYLAHSVIHLFTTSPNAEVRYFSEHFFSLPVGGRGLGVVRVCEFRGLAREALGLGLFQNVFGMFCRLSLPVTGGDSRFWFL
jgi:hypothetical protein